MNLEEIAVQLFNDSKQTPIRGLSAIAEAEKYLQQAYEGRYFFELIQNVRDANKEKGQDGEIFIELKNNILSIANTGAEFSDKGIEGITTIGRSTKQSQDYIGFKGIGFKSIQEITEEPKIVTRYGSIYFDRSLTIQKYANQELKLDDVPLFYFPHYYDRKLTEHETNKGIVTKIELPIKANITDDKIKKAFSEIKAKQLILLGNIESLHFETETEKTIFTIKKIASKRLIEVRENENPPSKFRTFTPNNKFSIPDDIIQSLEGKEKDIFSSTTNVDISIVLELADNGQIIPIENAKLYLFYPLLISSGFRFIIHSYFLVNPERTALRASLLNDYLQVSIGQYIGKEMLRQLKETKSNTNKILCFKRNNDAKINLLYNTIVAQLKNQKFIYDSQSQKYFYPSEVIVADGFDRVLFSDGKLGGKQLIYTDDKEIIEWLELEFAVPYLSYEDIANQIENECKRQAKEKKLGFFQKLYNYVSQNEGLNLTGKKVLLTEDWKLVSSDEDVFYGGGKKKPINLTATIRKQIHFIHSGIKLSDFREGKSRTGIIEYNTNALVTRLLKLFEKGLVPNIDILNTIYNLPQLDNKSEIEIKEKIYFPVLGKTKWLSPITNPIYFKTENLMDLYPNGNFIDEGLLKAEGNREDIVSVHNFLKKFGVWDIPAVYVSEKSVRLLVKDSRNEIIENVSGLVSRPFSIRKDRILDRPVKYNYWFTNIIIENWNYYKSFITSKLLPALQYDSSQSTYMRNAEENIVLQLSDFAETLSTHKWVAFSGEDALYSVNEICGINQHDFYQYHNQVIGKYLKLLPISYDLKQDLINSIGLVHLDGNTIKNFIEILKRIYKTYEVEIPGTKDFTDFYNRILNKLVDFFYDNNQTESIIQLRNEYFLAVDDITKIQLWAKAYQIYYIDDKPNYELLPVRIKEKVQPHFTKKDKNTFGKIASKIGKKFTSSIKKELIQSELIRTDTLPVFFEYLPEAIAILESKYDTVLNEYFERIKAIHVFEREFLEIKVSVGNSEELIIPVNHFVDTNNNYDFHFSKTNNPNKNKQMAESISELFINLLGRDLKSFNVDLLRFLNTTDKNEYLRDYDIVEERVNEIRDKLTTSNLTITQKFWEAILAAKGINRRENIFVGEEVDYKLISNLLNVDEMAIEVFQNNFNFQDKNDANNINPLIQLFSSISLTLETANQLLFPKIDFRFFYDKELNNLKNKFEKGFELILFNFLSSQDTAMKSLYQNYLDKYKAHKYSVSQVTLQLNVVEYFLKVLSEQFKFLNFTEDDLKSNVRLFDSVAIFKNNVNLFKSKMVGIEFTNENLDIFLSENKTRSLFYFNELDVLVERFKEWVKNNKGKNKPTSEEADLEEFLRQFTNQTGTKIEPTNTQDVIVPPTNGGNGGGNGNRFDGSASDQFKKRLGLAAEMIVCEKLKTLYSNVTWVSKNASKIHKTHPCYNPEGEDGLGYDIEYLDVAGNKYFVEVKGRADNYDSFEISKYEIDKAYQTKEYYKIFLVTQTLNNLQRRIRDLGNIFILNDGQDFFSNTKFKAVYKNFEIRFKEL